MGVAVGPNLFGLAPRLPEFGGILQDASTSPDSNADGFRGYSRRGAEDAEQGVEFSVSEFIGNSRHLILQAL